MNDTETAMQRKAWLLAALSVTAADAHAQSTVMVLGQSLALAGGMGGVVFGAIAGWRTAETLRMGLAFLIYLGLLCVVASTWSGSLEIVPLALVLGAVAGILPFAACFFMARRGVARLRAKVAPQHCATDPEARSPPERRAR
jgi:hypothetical protein